MIIAFYYLPDPDHVNKSTLIFYVLVMYPSTGLSERQLAKSIKKGILKNRISIVVISDTHRAAKQICDHLNAEPDLSALEDVGTNIDSYTLPRESCADLIIVQVTNRPIDGFKWIAKLRSVFSNLPIILISRGEEIVSTEKALRLGANGYVTLETETTDILTATRCVLAGDRYTSKQYIQWLIQRAALGRSTSIRHLLSDLSKQERRVFECIGDGQSNRSIAEDIGIHAKTVATYRSRIKIKLGINDGRILAEIASECKHADGLTPFTVPVLKLV